MMTLLPRLRLIFEGLIHQRSRLNFQALFSIEGVLTDPLLVFPDAVGPELDAGNQGRIGHVVEPGAEARSKRAKGTATRILPEKTDHPPHVCLLPRTLGHPVNRFQFPPMRENGTAWKMELGVRA